MDEFEEFQQRGALKESILHGVDPPKNIPSSPLNYHLFVNFKCLIAKVFFLLIFFIFNFCIFVFKNYLFTSFK